MKTFFHRIVYFFLAYYVTNLIGGGTDCLRGDPLQLCFSDPLNNQPNFSCKKGGGLENPLVRICFLFYFTICCGIFLVSLLYCWLILVLL